jgi:hypothetical protein
MQGILKGLRIPLKAVIAIFLILMRSTLACAKTRTLASPQSVRHEPAVIGGSSINTASPTSGRWCRDLGGSIFCRRSARDQWAGLHQRSRVPHRAERQPIAFSGRPGQAGTHGRKTRGDQRNLVI